MDSSATSSDMWSARFTNSPGVCSTSGRRRYSVSALQAAMQVLLPESVNARAMRTQNGLVGSRILHTNADYCILTSVGYTDLSSGGTSARTAGDSLAAAASRTSAAS